MSTAVASFRNVDRGYLKKDGLTIEIALEANVKIGPADRVAVYKQDDGKLTRISEFQWVEKGAEDSSGSMSIHLDSSKLVRVKSSTSSSPYKYCFVYEDYSGKVLAQSQTFFLCDKEEDLSALVPQGLASGGSSFDMLSFPEGNFDGEWPTNVGDRVNSGLVCWSGSIVTSQPSDESLGVVSLKTEGERRESIPVLEIHSRDPSPSGQSPPKPLKQTSEEISVKEATLTLEGDCVSPSSLSPEGASNLSSYSPLVLEIEDTEQKSSLHEEVPLSISSSHPPVDSQLSELASALNQPSPVGSTCEGNSVCLSLPSMEDTGDVPSVSSNDVMEGTGDIPSVSSNDVMEGTGDIPSVSSNDVVVVMSTAELQRKDQEIVMLKKQLKTLNVQLQLQEEKLEEKVKVVRSSNNKIKDLQADLADRKSVYDENQKLKKQLTDVLEENVALKKESSKHKSKVVYLQESLDKAMYAKHQADREAELLAVKVSQFEKGMSKGVRRPKSASTIEEVADTFQNTSNGENTKDEKLANQQQQQQQQQGGVAFSSINSIPTRRQSTSTCVAGDSPNDDVAQSRTQYIKRNSSSCDDLNGLHQSSNTIERKMFKERSKQNEDHLTSDQIASLAISLEGPGAVCPYCKTHLLGYETEISRVLHIESCLENLNKRGRE